MRVRSPPEPLRVNVTHADLVHHLPDRRGSDGGEACSSITAKDPPARTLLKPDARQRRPPGRLFIAFPAGVGAMAVETETLTRRLRCRQRACEGPHRSKPYWCDAGLFSLPAPSLSDRPQCQSPACEQESGQAAQDATRRRYAGRPEDFHYNKGLDGKISIQPFELPAVCYLAWRAIMS